VINFGALNRFEEFRNSRHVKCAHLYAFNSRWVNGVDGVADKDLHLYCPATYGTKRIVDVSDRPLG